MITRTLTLAEVADLPAVTDLVTAGQALGLGRSKAYELARAGQFPCPVIRAGKAWLVPTAGLLALLGLPVPGTGHQDGDQGEPSARRRSDANGRSKRLQDAGPDTPPRASATRTHAPGQRRDPRPGDPSPAGLTARRQPSVDAPDQRIPGHQGRTPRQPAAEHRASPDGPATSARQEYLTWPLAARTPLAVPRRR